MDQLPSFGHERRTAESLGNAKPDSLRGIKPLDAGDIVRAEVFLCRFAAELKKKSDDSMAPLLAIPNELRAAVVKFSFLDVEPFARSKLSAQVVKPR